MNSAAPPSAATWLRDLPDDVERQARLLEDGPGRRRDAQRLLTRGSQTEGEAATRIEPDEPLAPALRRHHELVERQGIEEFIGDDDHGAGQGVADIVVPDRIGALQRGRLPLAQNRAGLDEMHRDRLAKARDDPGRPQHVGHQRAPPRPELDQAQSRGCPHRLPEMGCPEPDQLAEHLADLGRRGEIALLPEGIARHVVAMARMAERKAHVAADADRSLLPDQLDDLGLEGIHARTSPCGPRRLRSTSQRPAKKTGSESSMPMVMPPESASTEVPNRKPSCGSGSRKNSQTIRASA